MKKKRKNTIFTETNMLWSRVYDFLFPAGQQRSPKAQLEEVLPELDKLPEDLHSHARDGHLLCLLSLLAKEILGSCDATNAFRCGLGSFLKYHLDELVPGAERMTYKDQPIHDWLADKLCYQNDCQSLELGKQLDPLLKMSQGCAENPDEPPCKAVMRLILSGTALLFGREVKIFFEDGSIEMYKGSLKPVRLRQLKTGHFVTEKKILM